MPGEIHRRGHRGGLVASCWAKRPQQCGALLLAGHDVNGQLTAVGHVGTGFSAVARRRLFDQLVRIERKASPLSAISSRQWKGVRWVQPHYVGEVEYREYLTAYGLRHTSWKGLRDVDRH